MTSSPVDATAVRAVIEPSAAAFLAVAGPVLATAATLNNLPLGFAIRWTDAEPPPGEAPTFIAVLDDDRCIGGAVLVAGGHLFVSVLAGVGVTVEAQATAVVAAVRAQPVAMTAVTGPVAVIAAFAAAWAAAGGAPLRPDIQLRAMELHRVVAPAPSSGAMRVAEDGDLDRVVDWMIAFADEAGRIHRGDRRAAAELGIRRRRIHLWIDEVPVAMAMLGRNLPGGVTIGPVYTPPDRRGRGYATGLMAALSTAALASGLDFCSLFTDIANPTSNAIYQRIGYLPVGDLIELRVA